MSANPVVVRFIVDGVDNVKKAMKGIADTVSGTEQKSTAAARLGMSDRERLAEKETQAKAHAYTQTAALLAAAERSGSKTAEKALRDRLATLGAHLRADYDARQTARAKNLQAAAASQNVEHGRAKATADRWVSEANRAAKAQLTITQRVAREQGRLRAEALRNVPSARPELGPQARLAVLHAAKNKTPEEQHAALATVHTMRREDRAHNANARDEKKLQDAKTRETEKGEKDRLGIRERSMQMESRYLDTKLRTEANARKRTDADAQRHREQFARAVYGGAGTAARSAGTIAGRVGTSLFHGVAGLGGGFTVEGALQERVDLEKRSAVLAVKTDGAYTTADVQAKARTLAVRTGTDADKVLGGWEGYGDKSGDWKGGEQIAEFIARYAKVSGADTKQAGTVAGLLRIQNKDLGPEQMKQMLLDVLEQGRENAVDLPDLIGRLPALTKTSGNWGKGTQAENQRRLIALSQIGIATGSVAEVATGLTHLSGDAQKHSKEVNHLLGRNAFDSKGRIASTQEDFIADMLTASGGSRSKIYGALKGERSIKIFDALLPTFNKAEKSVLDSGGTKKEALAAGRAAVMTEMKKPIDATMTMAQLDKDFSNIMKTSAEQFEGAVRELKTEVADGLLPVLKDLLPLFRQLTPPLASALDSFTKLAALAANNPFEALSTVFGTYLVKELASAELGQALRTFGSSAAGASGPLASTGTAAAGASGALTLLAAGVTAQTLMMSRYVDQILGANQRGSEKGETLAARVARGGPDGEAAQRELAVATEKGSAGRLALAGADYAARGLQLLTNPMGAAAQLIGDTAGAGLGTRAAGWVGYNPGDKRGLSSTDVSQETIEAKATTASFDAVISSNTKLSAALDRNTKATEANSKPPTPIPPPPTAHGTAPNRGATIPARTK